MANRENSSDSTSQSGKSYPAGSAAAATANVVKNISLTLDDQKTRVSKLGSGGAFNGHAVQVHGDGAVWDTVSNVYLYPGRDFNPGDVQRT